MFAYLLIIGLIWLGIAIMIVYKKTGDWFIHFEVVDQLKEKNNI